MRGDFLALALPCITLYIPCNRIIDMRADFLTSALPCITLYIFCKNPWREGGFFESTLSHHIFASLAIQFLSRSNFLHLHFLTSHVYILCNRILHEDLDFPASTTLFTNLHLLVVQLFLTRWVSWNHKRFLSHMEVWGTFRSLYNL